MSALNNTKFDAVLQNVWRKGIELAVLEKSKFAAMCDKTPFGDKTRELVCDDSHAGFSNSFTVAQQNKDASTPFAFSVTRAKGYVQGSIEGETQEATSGNVQSASALRHLLEKKRIEYAHGLSWSAWQGQGGAIGQVGSSTSTTIVLSAVSDHVNFNVGQRHQFSTTNTSSSTAHSSGAVIEVTAINRETGTLTYADTTTIGSLADDDYIFLEGCVGQNAAGVLAWVSPDATPGTLFGVTRTTDRNRRAGIRFDASGYDPISALIQANGVYSEQVREEATCVWMSPRRYADVEMALEGKAKADKANGKSSKGYDISFDAIRYGDLLLMKDAFCPNSYFLMTQMKGNWKCGTTKSGLPHFQTSGGMKLYPEPNSDADQFRMRGYYQWWTEKPWANLLGAWDGF